MTYNNYPNEQIPIYLLILTFTALTLIIALILTSTTKNHYWNRILILILKSTTKFIQCTRNTKKTKEKMTILKTPPRPPIRLPIIGHLPYLAGYKVPYAAFTALGKKYGNVVGLQLGSMQCIVVNGPNLIKEVLIAKGNHFDSRPNFQRYHQLFDGNKENSLAFCNWSTQQKARRNMLKVHTFPKAYTANFASLETVIANATSTLSQLIDGTTQTQAFDLKTALSKVTANVFTQHFCSRTFPLHNAKFNGMIQDYDDIFYEVNQGYAADFLPFLLPFHKNNLKRINNCTVNIRRFIEEEIIGDRHDTVKKSSIGDDMDFVEALIAHVKQQEASTDTELTWDGALFALEDILGGHSAVANFLIKVLAFLAQEPDCQDEMYREINEMMHLTGHRTSTVTISDRHSLPYTEAAILEALRLIASPIVPRVANRASSIDGYAVDTGTMIFLNNYDLSMSPDLWVNPEKFDPKRFMRDGRVHKPDHFLPFGGGRRSCMGYKMVQFISFGILTGLMQQYRITLTSDKDNKAIVSKPIEVPVGSLALPRDTFHFQFVKR